METSFQIQRLYEGNNMKVSHSEDPSAAYTASLLGLRRDTSVTFQETYTTPVNSPFSIN